MRILGNQKRRRRIAQRPKQCWKKKPGLIAAVFLVAVFLFVLGGTAFGGYTTTQITKGEIYGSAMNDGGQVVWETDGSPGGIFLYSDGVTTQLAAIGGSLMAPNPQVNAGGDVVWSGWDGTDYEIFLYSNGVTTQLTNDSYYDYYPQINDNGQVVWEGNGIFLYTPGSGTTQLSSNGSGPQINNSGQVVWKGGYGSDSEIFLYSNGTTTQLTHNSYYDGGPQINNNGHVVWQRGYTGSDSEIFLYSGGVTTQLTDNGNNSAPQINDNGQVVWEGNGVLLYTPGSGTTQLSSHGSGPQINNSGQVVWHGGLEIFLFSGGTITQLTDDDAWDWAPKINNSGQVIWETWFSSDGGIFMASPCSDGKPTLTLSRAKVYWASYADYQARALSVDYSIANAGSDLANEVQITGSTATNGVTLLTAMPLSVGDLGGGSAATSTLKYTVPPGVASFRAMVNAEATDACANSYTYP